MNYYLIISAQETKQTNKQTSKQTKTKEFTNIDRFIWKSRCLIRSEKKQSKKTKEQKEGL